MEFASLQSTTLLQPISAGLFSAELEPQLEFLRVSSLCLFPLEQQTVAMSFSTLVQDLTFKDKDSIRTDTASQVSRAKSYASTAATSVSISGDISSQLHGGYSHPLARAWQAERQLTKVCTPISD